MAIGRFLRRTVHIRTVLRRKWLELQTRFGPLRRRDRLRDAHAARAFEECQVQPPTPTGGPNRQFKPDRLTFCDDLYYTNDGNNILDEASRTFPTLSRGRAGRDRPRNAHKKRQVCTPA